MLTITLAILAERAVIIQQSLPLRPLRYIVQTAFEITPSSPDIHGASNLGRSMRARNLQFGKKSQLRAKSFSFVATQYQKISTARIPVVCYQRLHCVLQCGLLVRVALLFLWALFFIFALLVPFIFLFLFALFVLLFLFALLILFAFVVLCSLLVLFALLFLLALLVLLALFVFFAALQYIMQCYERETSNST